MDYIIRPICLGDEKEINAIRTMPGVIENILGIPSERIKESEDFFNRLGPNDHSFVAVIKIPDGSEKVVGVAGLSVNSMARKRHCAGIGMMVRTEYQGIGIGKALLDALIDLADNWLMLVRLELDVYIDNERAVNLYESAGFVKEGTLRKAAIKNGEYADLYFMARVK